MPPGGLLMTEPNAELQFDRAQFETPKSAVCASCQRTLSGSYYEINGRLACEACRMKAEWDWNNSSGVGRFLRAAAFGTAAAIAGAVIYYGVTALTGYELSLISILVGIMVGIAVRVGSRGRGGWKYQCLAMFLTYTSIMAAYSPMILKGLSEGIKKADAKTATSTAPAAAEPATRPATRPSALGILLGIGVIVAVVYATPLLLIAHGTGFISVFIIGIGVWQSWKLNRKTELQISGPFSLSTRPAPAPPAA
jgi:hypothetical protein